MTLRPWTLCILVSLVLCSSASARVRPLSDVELSGVRAGYSGNNGGCVTGSACGTASNFSYVCTDAKNWWNGRDCTSIGYICSSTSGPAGGGAVPINVVCTAGMGSGCTGATVVPCLIQTVYLCQQAYLFTGEPYNCNCVLSKSTGVGSYDTCTPTTPPPPPPQGA